MEQQERPVPLPMPSDDPTYFRDILQQAELKLRTILNGNDATVALGRYSYRDFQRMNCASLPIDASYF